LSLSTGYNLIHDDLRLVGYSVAGTSTSVACPEADVLFDVAQGLPYQTAYNTILLTHAHMDHASGLPYLISQKSMQQRPRPVIYMPEAAVAPLSKIMKLWEEIDEFKYAYEFKVAQPGEEIPLKPGYFAKTFPTYHRIPSQGYTVFRRRKKLKDEFQLLAKTDPQKLASLRREGVILEEDVEENLVSFTGDTKIEFLQTDYARKSRLLLMEVTYWDNRKSVENARSWGHIHFEEFLEALPKIEAERICLIHVSARYSTKDLHAILEARVPEHFKAKLMIFPRPT
jgi:ribonuclease Z